jgi:hypothetical protein
MATPIKRIEKEYMLRMIFDNKLPIMYLCDRTEYVLHLEKQPKNEMAFTVDRPIAGLKIRQKLELMFEYRGQIITFTVEVMDINGVRITTLIPDAFYKNLDRSYSRVTGPADLRIQLALHGDRYSLHYPKVEDYDKGEIIDEKIKSLDSKDLQGVIVQIAGFLRGFATGHKIVVFKEVQPTTLEERVVAQTGKTFFLPSSTGKLPQSDPYVNKRLITEEMFAHFLETTGIMPFLTDEETAKFIQQKHEAKFYSDAWVPILFQEYVIGYIHIWIDVDGKPPLEYSVIEKLYQYAAVLARAFKARGLFESGRVKNEPFEGKVTDISVSGLLFSYPLSSFSEILLLDCELMVKLITPKRTVQTIAHIKRRYKDNALGYFGCHFDDLAPEDMRFLFEYLYGKVFDDAESSLLTGQV